MIVLADLLYHHKQLEQTNVETPECLTPGTECNLCGNAGWSQQLSYVPRSFNRTRAVSSSKPQVRELEP